MDEREYRLLHVAAYMALFVVGMYAASFGPALPFLADDLNVSLDTAGLMLTALFFGSIIASASIAVVLHGRDMRLLTALGLTAMVAGLVTIAVAPNIWVAFAGGAMLGAGDGLVIAALHILMAITSKDAPSAISRLNLWFAVGAFAGPIWAGGILQLSEERALVYGGIAVLAAIAFVLMLLSHAPSHDVITPHDAAPRMLPGNPTAWFMGGVLFLYVGAEFGLGSWVSEYAKETTDASVFGAALLTSGYWGALALGRIASTWYFARQREASLLLLASVGGAGLCSLALALTTGNIIVSAAAAFGAGLFLGPVWPAVLAIASKDNPANATAATVTMGNAGGLAIPWLQGKVLVSAGPAQGVAVTAVLCGLMFAAVAGFRIRRKGVG